MKINKSLKKSNLKNTRIYLIKSTYFIYLKDFNNNYEHSNNFQHFFHLFINCNIYNNHKIDNKNYLRKYI